ncbi:MAG: DUF4221 family protein [Anditalea sp.]
MEALKLDKKIRFEKEGPSGTGSYVTQMNYLSDEKILLTEYHQIGLYNTSAEKTFQLKIRDQVFKRDSLEEKETLSPRGLLDETGTYFLTTYEKGFGEILGLAKIHLKDKSLVKIPIPGLKDLEKFKVFFSDEQGMSAYHPSLYLQLVQGKILISNSAINEVYAYDVQKDSLMKRSFESSITANRQADNPRNQVSSSEEMDKIIQEMRKEVNFSRYAYDNLNKRYYRFSKEFEKETAEGNRFNIVLTTFDNGLNQIHETNALSISKVPSKYFVKDGNLYLFENIEDEMGFIVMEVQKL